MENTTNIANLEGLRKIPEFIRFVEWCAIPDALKEPKTQKELALLINVEQGTLSDWKKRPEYYDLVRDEMRRWGKGKTQNIIGALYRKAVQEGNAQEAKLWFQFIEDWKEKTEQESKNIHYVITRGEHRIIPTSPETTGDSESSG